MALDRCEEEQGVIWEVLGQSQAEINITQLWVDVIKNKAAENLLSLGRYWMLDHKTSDHWQS